MFSWSSNITCKKYFFSSSSSFQEPCICMSLSHSSTTRLDWGRGGIIHIALGQAILQCKAERWRAEGQRACCTTCPWHGGGWVQERSSACYSYFCLSEVECYIDTCFAKFGNEKKIQQGPCPEVPVRARPGCCTPCSIAVSQFKVGWKYLMYSCTTKKP